MFDKEYEIANYFNLRQQIEALRHQMSNIISQPKHAINFMNPGRLIKVVNKNDDFGWGVVINFRKRPNSKFVSDLDPCDLDPCDLEPCDLEPCDLEPCDLEPCDLEPSDLDFLTE